MCECLFVCLPACMWPVSVCMCPHTSYLAKSGFFFFTSFFFSFAVPSMHIYIYICAVLCHAMDLDAIYTHYWDSGI